MVIICYNAVYVFELITNRNWSGFPAYAGGAILMVLAKSMIPEAYEHGGKVTGIVMVFGFFVTVEMVILEHS